MINQTNILIDATEEAKKLHVPPSGGRITEEDYYNLKAELEALTEHNQRLVDAVRVASTAEVFSEEGIINLEAIEAVQGIARSTLKELGL